MVEHTPYGQIVLRGIPASPGLAAGPLQVIDVSRRSEVDEAVGSSEEERNRLQKALQAAVSNLERILEASTDPEASGMLEFQIAMLEDDSLTEPCQTAIGRGARATAAWHETLDAEIEGYRSAEDEYFSARAIDLEDIRDRVLRHLRGSENEQIPPGAIVLGDELSPSRFLEHRSRIAGIALRRGSSSSHVAILARAQGTPMLVRVQNGSVNSGAEALLDARNGTLAVRPEAETRARFQALLADIQEEQRAAETYLHRNARLPDGERVLVMLNVADPDDLDGLDPAICDGIGLVRTEFLFDGRASLPDEDEQLDAYRRLVEWAAGRPVTIRTLDAGGDKPIPGLTPEHECNPFLGVRGLRLSLRVPDVLKTQLRALVRAAQLGPVKVMLPMVTDPAELEEARKLVAEVVVEIGGRTSAPPPFELGIMVEVPACALTVERFDADFFSIGSNDLLQYLTACGRDSSDLESLARPDNPALLSLIESIVAKGNSHGKAVSLCGDMGGDTRYLPLLLDRGLRAVSVSAAAIARAKATVATHGSRVHE